MDNLKAFKALTAEWQDFCDQQERCADCPYNEYNEVYECTARFVFDKLTMGTTEPVTPAVEEEEEVFKLPEWCKKGVWVICDTGVFFRVDWTSETKAVLVREDGVKRFESSSSLLEDYLQVPFEMYALGEAIKLIGQVMLITGERAEVIHSAAIDGTTGDVLINDLHAGHYRDKRPTINGIPFGTPGISADEIIKRGARKKANPLVGKMEGVLQHGQHELQALPGDAAGDAPGREVLGD